MPPPSWDKDKLWQYELQRPVSRRNVTAGVNLAENPSPGYYLYILVNAVGISFADANQFFETLYKHPRGSKDSTTIGHAWIILEKPNDSLESGHTGEFDIDQPTYYQRFMRKVHSRDPNPSSVLWDRLSDGKYHQGAEGHAPTFVAGVSITEQQYRSIFEYINSYDYSIFAITDRQCTDFVAGAARLAGINLTHRIKLTLPSYGYFKGQTFVLWTSPEYSVVTIGSPDILEADLKLLVAEGLAFDATQWYLR